ncbi:MAG: hypothetical protein JNK02_07165 [Planctomycetes bacterium]|nr:hypothetical protein [Planctomycetota bacterium]
MSALRPPLRILVRAPSWLGDFVACEPVLRALHARHAAAGLAQRLTIVAPAPFLELVRARLAGARLVAAARGTAPDPRAWAGHDSALLLDGSARSAWCALRAGIGCRIGWSGGGRGPLLTLGATPARERGATPLGLGVHGRWPRRLPRPFASACAELAGLGGLEVRERTPCLEPDPAATARARARLAERGLEPDAPFLLVNAGGRPHSAKAAEPAALAARARAAGMAVVLVCGPGEERHARATCELLAGVRALLLDDPPPTLAELVALSGLSSACLTADSGPRHVAQALGKPVTVLCGPTDPRHTAEHAANVTVLRAEVPCGPCHREVCPLRGEEQRACMRLLALDRNANPDRG